MTRILLRRVAALGDVLFATPIAARLRREFPEAEITVETGYPAVWIDNPHITSIGRHGIYNKIVDLDMAHETHRAMHQIVAYMRVAFGDDGTGHDKTVVFPHRIPPPDLGVDWSKTVTIHSNNSWRNRTMPPEWWETAIAAIRAAGFSVVALGTQIDPEVDNVIDTRGKLTLKEQAAAIEASRVFLCGGSGLFMLSGCTKTPVVVPITISRPEHCLPFRGDVLGTGYHPIVADISCMGCNERQGPVTFVGCERNDYACIPLIPVETAIKLTLDLARR